MRDGVASKYKEINLAPVSKIDSSLDIKVTLNWSSTRVCVQLFSVYIGWRDFTFGLVFRKGFHLGFHVVV